MFGGDVLLSVVWCETKIATSTLYGKTKVGMFSRGLSAAIPLEDRLP